jgi:magnesium chelatase family protein
MIAKVKSAAVVGIDAQMVQVEVDVSSGMPHMFIVGLPDKAVQEAEQRVRSAVKNSECFFPYKRVTVNLAPADLKKEGPAYDLAIAIGILISTEQVCADVTDTLFLGELSLDGMVRHIQGTLPMVAMARDIGLKRVFVPETDAREASLIRDVSVFPVSSLAQLVSHLSGRISITPYEAAEDSSKLDLGLPGPDLAHVKGQEHAKRALEVAAAGGHNMAMQGPPGSGKTMLARCLPSILPVMTFPEALEVTKIYSVSGMLPADTPLVMHRPFRSPHYTISHAGLVGGGQWPRPGEISLSHRGVLFLDELPEFSHMALESLRQPLEDKNVTISRALGSVMFPANFMLVAAMNPCPCGYYGDPVKECRCSSGEVTRYHKKISGPLLDRIDISVEVPRVDYEKLTDERLAERSESVRTRTEAARLIQVRRFAGGKLTCNADMGAEEVREFCKIEPSAHGLLRTAMRQLNMTARAFHRVLKLARTIADLDAADVIAVSHLAEAIQYRPRTAA